MDKAQAGRYDRRKIANHYHVLTGLPGYMPNSNYPCETLKEAGDIALYEANEFREAGYHRDWGEDCQGIVVGNKRDGYSVLHPAYSGSGNIPRNCEWSLWQTITISPCDITDCRCVKCGTLLYEEDCIYQECG